MKSTKKEVTSGYETITPQKAREYLGTSIGNRPIKAAKVQLFAQYMKAGEWNRYAQPIYFDEDGRLMEGHTRLNAVVKCGATVEMNVVRNFPRAEWSKLNSASIWTAGDFAAANGVKNANSSMSAVKIREALKRGLRIGSIGSVSKGKIQDHVWTNDDFLRLFNADKDWPEDMDFAALLYRQWYGISMSMCAGILHHLVHDCKWPRDFVCDFFRQVYTLEGITANARTLRKRIDMDRTGGAKLTPNYVCTLICKAFEGFATNVPKSKLSVCNVSNVIKFPRRKA